MRDDEAPAPMVHYLRHTHESCQHGAAPTQVVVWSARRAAPSTGWGLAGSTPFSIWYVSNQPRRLNFKDHQQTVMLSLHWPLAVPFMMFEMGASVASKAPAVQRCTAGRHLAPFFVPSPPPLGRCARSVHLAPLETGTWSDARSSGTAGRPHNDHAAAPLRTPSRAHALCAPRSTHLQAAGAIRSVDTLVCIILNLLRILRDGR